MKAKEEWKRKEISFVLLSFLKEKIKSCDFFNQVTDFYESSYERYAIWG
jgi:hypothetical protein